MEALTPLLKSKVDSAIEPYDVQQTCFVEVVTVQHISFLYI